MKYHPLLLLCVAVMSVSCAEVYKFVQVFEATPTDKTAIKAANGGMLYEDNNCAVFYSLWAEGGDASFEFYNKTNQIIYIDLSKSFFIRNGIANDYYKEREWSEAKLNSSAMLYSSTGSLYAGKSYSFGASATYLGNYGNMPLTANAPITTSTSASNSGSVGALYSASQANTIATSKSSSITIKEQKNIAVPPNSSKIITEYSISNILLVDCDLDRYPSEKASLSFDEGNTPLTFGNYITYRVGNNGQDIVVENQFYVSKITNYALPFVREFVERTEKPCQNVTTDDSKNYNPKYPVKVYDKVISIDTHNSFYIEYKKTSSRKLYQKTEGNYYYSDIYNGYTQGDSQSNGLTPLPRRD